MASLTQRGRTWHLVYYVGKKQKRVSLHTTSEQLAKDKLREFESAMFRGADNPLPTKTPLPEIIERYVSQLKARTREENVAKVVSNLRGVFGQISNSLKIKNEKIAAKSVKCTASENFDLIGLI